MALLAAAAFCAAAPTAAAAATVTSYEPSTVAAALLDAGYKARVYKDDDGNPRIDSASEGNDITVAFAGCKSGKDCDQVEFLAFWNCEDALKKCEAAHEKWNDDELFSKTIVVKNTLVMYRHLFMDKLGITSELFVRNFVQFSADAVTLEGSFPASKE